MTALQLSHDNTQATYLPLLPGLLLLFVISKTIV